MAINKNDIPPEQEQKLLERIARGDQESFMSLVHGHWNRVYGTVLTLVKSPQRAEEIAQDIFLKIWMQRDRLVNVRNFRDWIYVVGHNLVISEMRRKTAESTGEPEDILESNLNPERQLEFKETLNWIQAGIAQLTPQQQMVFKLSRIEGLTHDQIGKQLGISKNTVKGHMVLALNFLRTYMRNHLESMVILFLLFSRFMKK